MATGLQRPNYIAAVDLANSNIAIRLTVNRNVTSGDVPDTTTTHTTISLQDFVTMIGGAVADSLAAKPEIAALTAASTAANIVAALQA